MLKKLIIIAGLLILLIAVGLFLFNRIQNQPLPLSAECAVEPEILKSEDGVEYVRTSDACFDNLPDWDYEPHYVEIDGLRQAYIDEGPADADPILLLHGQPSWSYLYRYMIPVLVADGHRVIAMDHLGMGRSDKPTDIEYHSFDNHAYRLETFIKDLELDNLTLFAQDWGSVIGLYLAGLNHDLFDRIVLGNGGLPVLDEVAPLPEDIEASIKSFNRTVNMMPDKQPKFFDEDGNPTGILPDNAGVEGGVGEWIAYALYYEDFMPSIMLEGLTFEKLTREEKAAYDAPFPSRIYMAAPRTFPSLLNTMVGVLEPSREGLTSYDKPFLTIFGGNDPGLAAGADNQDEVINTIPGAAGQDHYRFSDASHFLQDDKGAEIAERVNQFIADNPIE